jgi:hypothetical protein
MVGCAGGADGGYGGFVVWLPGESADAAGDIRLVSRGPATPTVEAAYGPRALVDLPGPAAGAQPVRLRVPAIGTTAPLIELALEDDGALEVPRTPHQVGWYTKAPRPGGRGPAVLAGHVQLGRRAGVFEALRHVEPGDVVHVDYDDGTTFSFLTYAREQHAKDAFPTVRVYGDALGAELRLITCGGALDRATRHHVDNVVIYADLIARTWA